MLTRIEANKPWLNRVLAKVEADGDCLVYGGILIRGYGAVSAYGKTQRVHRLIYSQFVGKLDPNLVIDHICRNRACINPSHLRQIKNEQNVMIGAGPPARNARKIKCKNGHNFSKENTYVYSPRTRPGKTYRACKFCKVETTRLWRFKRQFG